jgi:hypothetical protein
MRYLFFVLAFALLSCSKSSTSENTSDTTQIALSTIDETKMNSPAVYVGFAGYLEETKEFYVSLYFKDIGDKVTPGDFGDSTIYDDGEGYFRKWIPLDKAREHFVLDGLDKLRLYNADHQLIGTASLLRVEYVEDMITSEYVAIYKFAHEHSDRYAPYYAVSDHVGDAFQKDFSSKEINDPATQCPHHRKPEARHRQPLGDEPLPHQTFRKNLLHRQLRQPGLHRRNRQRPIHHNGNHDRRLSLRSRISRSDHRKRKTDLTRHLP